LAVISALLLFNIVDNRWKKDIIAPEISYVMALRETAAGTGALTATPGLTPEPTFESIPEPTSEPTLEPTPEPTPATETVSISFVGDCTLGGDMLGPSENRFYRTVSKSGVIDYGYCFKNVRDIFAEDDLTVANLEVVLTESSDYVKPPGGGKIFRLRGRPEYVNFLLDGNIDVVNIDNNHIMDFGESGLIETIGHLNAAGISSYGIERILILDVKGVRVGFVGFNKWDISDALLKERITSARTLCDILIVSFHWGFELQYDAIAGQIEYGHNSVDLGADLVIGHHPHVINGIEVYKGVNIVYSLGNFCFGANENPADKDTFIYRHTFTVQNGEIISARPAIIPCKITSGTANNYQPTPVTGKAAESILAKIEKHSKQFKNPYDMRDIGIIYD
jgi:poly-gamma-glutamate synthesis protein (capsule biosynthesis protein)